MPRMLFFPLINVKMPYAGKMSCSAKLSMKIFYKLGALLNWTSTLFLKTVTVSFFALFIFFLQF